MAQNKLPYSIQIYFFNLFEKKIDIKVFEKKLYKCIKLENIDNALFLELISLNFNESNVIKNIKNIIFDRLDFVEYEKQYILKIINSIMQLDDNFPYSLNQVYQMSLYNYVFLENLENYTYSLAYEVGVFYDKNWNGYSISERQKIVKNFSENIIKECLDIKLKIENQEIIPSGEYIISNIF